MIPSQSHEAMTEVQHSYLQFLAQLQISLLPLEACLPHTLITGASQCQRSQRNQKQQMKQGDKFERELLRS